MVRYFDEVQAAIRQLQGEGIRVSLFIDADPAQIAAAAEAGAAVIELHTPGATPTPSPPASNMNCSASGPACWRGRSAA